MKTIASFALILPLILQLTPGHAQEDCSKCTATPSTDCKATDDPPLEGGSPCFCVKDALLAGCVLKSCDGVPQGEYCDSSLGHGGEPKRSNAFSHKCTGATDECECCTGYPKDCTEANNENPPAWGGEPCSCTASVPALGCVLKPCTSNADIFCVCNGNFKNTVCFASLCPGNQNGALVGDCRDNEPTTLIPTDTAPIDTSTDADTSMGTDGTTVRTTSDGDGGDTGDSGGTILMASGRILLASIAAAFIKIM